MVYKVIVLQGYISSVNIEKSLKTKTDLTEAIDQVVFLMCKLNK